MKKLFFKKKGFTPTPKFGVRLRSKRGFTLIELLVVIAIIGLLATIVLVSLNTARQKARDTRRISDLRQVALALEMYYDDVRTYPVAAQGCSVANWTTMSTALSAGTIVYMPAVPKDPTDSASLGLQYQYGLGTDFASPQRYLLRALLEKHNTANDTDVDGTPTGYTGCLCGTQSTTETQYCIQP